MRAILIDANSKSVRGIDMPVFHHRDVARLLDCDLIQMVVVGRDMLFVDEEGLLKHDPGPFFKYPGFDQPLPNKGLLFGIRDDGEPTSTRVSLHALIHNLEWPDIEFVGFEPLHETVTIPGSERDVEVIGFRAVFRPKPHHGTDT